MSKWAVLGSNSFSGNAFCNYLLQRGEKIVPYQRPDWDINDHAVQMARNIAEVKPDYVVNFIAKSMVAQSWEDPRSWMRTNVVATTEFINELNKLRGSWLKRCVHISTPEVYGSTGVALKEDAPFNPSTPYAVSRAAADMMLRAYHKAYGFPVVFTRTVNVYGPGQQLYRIIPKTIMCILGGQKLKLHGGGYSTRSFIHIEDVCEAYYLSATQGKVGETYHSATSVQTSILQLVLEICEAMGVKRFDDVIKVVPGTPGIDMNYQLNDSKLRALGWLDRIRLSDGIDHTIAWVRNSYETLKLQPQHYVDKP